MSIFSSLFGYSENDNKSTSNVNWISLVDLGQLNEIITLSATQPVLIFKHSTTCGISRMAMKQFESQFDLNDRVTSYYLDLLSYRAVSNEVAARFGVQHQSPQLLLIEDGKVVYDVSHGDIDVADLRMKLSL
ncbi:bacillithiol system redox-active protein YtxJ [Flavobacterium sp.]|uniref:bacillithiol system redox-active protein YtxJ n=1 Tax=Flavobacterium sp. TaxID=239 RepID=UPI00286A36D9|nr:bacillithiol system redox-active protein YtxJ [Flavobacterium sp.]